jgi:predicted TIM-barrel fold metal-dependent hydrolase
MVPEPIHRARAVARAVRLGRDPSAAAETVDHMKENINDPNADLIRRDLESAGFTRAIMPNIDWGLVAGDITELTPEAQLEWVRSIAERHRGFITVLFGIDPRRPEAAKISREALATEGIAGIKLYPPCGFSPADEVCDPIYETVADAGAFVMFHTGRQTYPFDLAFGRLEPYGAVQRRFPSLRLVLAHAGWPFWGREACEIAAGHPATWIDVSNWHHGLEHELPRVQEFLRHAWRQLGPRRVLFGSDGFSGPRSTGVKTLARWREVFVETAAEAGVDLAETEAGVDELLAR